MNPGYPPRPGRRTAVGRPRGSAVTAILGVIVGLVDLASSALLWAITAAVLPDVATGWALAGFALVSLAVFAWPGPRRGGRLLAFWCLPVGMLRGLAIGWRRWLAGHPGLDLLWRARFILGIAAIVQDALEGAWLIGLLPAGIIAVSYLLPWLRRLHARRVAAGGPTRPTLELGTGGAIRGRRDKVHGHLGGVS